MTLLLAGLWPGLALAAVLGAGVGWLCGPPRGWSAPAVLAGAVLGLAGLAALGVVRGPAGLWVETATAMLAVYVLACGLGALGRMGLRRRRPRNPGAAGTRTP